jgi:hypothetical protein
VKFSKVIAAARRLTSPGISAQSRKTERNHSSTRLSAGIVGSKVVIAKVAISGAGSDGSSAGPSSNFRQGPAFSRIDSAANSASALST